MNDIETIIEDLLENSLSYNEFLIKLDLNGISKEEFKNWISDECVCSVFEEELTFKIEKSKENIVSSYCKFISEVIESGLLDHKLFILATYVLEIGFSLKNEEQLSCVLGIVKSITERRNKLLKNKNLVV